MNRHTFLWASLVIIFFVLCAKTTLATSVFALLVLGVIPGTTATIPAWVMLTAYPALFLLTTYWLGTQRLYIGEAAAPIKPLKTKAVKTKLKRTSRRKNATTTKKRVSAVV